jgi:hypothetical protein
MLNAQRMANPQATATPQAHGVEMIPLVYEGIDSHKILTKPSF